MKNLVSYGQHYLKNNSFFEIMLDSAKIVKSDTVLEIGAGDGRLTKLISQKAKFVHSFEIDDSTKNLLLNLKLKNCKFHFINYLKSSEDIMFNKIVASLPYQITEPFVESIINKNFECAVLIVGKNFAKNCESLNYNKNSVMVNTFFNVEYICDIEPKEFDPPPSVYSSVIKLTPKTEQQINSEQVYFIFKQLFMQRDKKVKNALKEAIISFYAYTNNSCTQKQSKEIIKQLFNEDFDCYLVNQNNAFYEMLFEKIKNYNFF